jgi:hypothetical protein
LICRSMDLPAPLATGTTDTYATADSVAISTSIPAKHLPRLSRGESGLTETARVLVFPWPRVRLRLPLALGRHEEVEVIRSKQPLPRHRVRPPVHHREQPRRRFTGRHTKQPVRIDVIDAPADVTRRVPELVELEDELVGVGLR